MTNRRDIATAIASAALVAALTACGTDSPSPVAGATDPSATTDPTATDPSAAAALAGAGLTPTDFYPDANFFFADDVAEWLDIGDVSQAVSGTLLGAEVGPAVTEVDEVTGDLFVVNTALLQVEVEESFVGDAKPGDVVSVAMWAGSGRQLPPDATIPLQPLDSGFSVAEFDQAFPPGARVIAMSNPHSIEKLMVGSNERSGSVYPDGLRKQSEYMSGRHPQAVVVDTPATLTGEKRAAATTTYGVPFDDVLAQLSDATTN